MKKLLVQFLCLITLCYAVACDSDVSTDIEKVQNSTNETLETEKSESSDYKAAYSEFLKDKKESYSSFNLVFIDNDDIPELYLSGVNEAVGDMICSFKNDTVIYQRLGRLGGGKYIERSGNLVNQNGTMGIYYTNVYKLDENGFSETFNANYTEKYESVGNEEYVILREYFINGASVNEDEYNSAVNSNFDFSKAVSLDENAVSFEEILKLLQDDNAEN